MNQTRDVIAGRACWGRVSAGTAALPVHDIGRRARAAPTVRDWSPPSPRSWPRPAANIVSLDQHSTEETGGIFMQRTISNLPALPRPATWRRRSPSRSPPVRDGLPADRGRQAQAGRADGLREDHCLLDLLWRDRRGELEMSIAMVIGNHPDPADQARPFGVPFIHIPATMIRDVAEQRQLDLLRGNVDLVILARYMQIPDAPLLEEVGCPVINIHHSFLPAFIGASPYRRAKERGVKLVGATTAHYVTADFDEGPIIEQDRSASTTGTASRTWFGWAPTSSVRCSPGPCSGTAKTG